MNPFLRSEKCRSCISLNKAYQSRTSKAGEIYDGVRDVLLELPCSFEREILLTETTSPAYKRPMFSRLQAGRYAFWIAISAGVGPSCFGLSKSPHSSQVLFPAIYLFGFAGAFWSSVQPKAVYHLRAYVCFCIYSSSSIVCLSRIGEKLVSVCHACAGDLTHSSQ
jgi:hypothetical protein